MKHPCFCFVGGNMEAGTYLQQIEKYDRMIENRKYEILDLRSRASLPAGFSSNTKVQTTRRPDRAENLIINYIEKEEILQEEINNFWKKRQDIIRTIEQLTTSEYGLLYCVYVERKTLYEVADQFDKSYSWATYTKKKALASLQQILDEREKNEL